MKKQKQLFVFLLILISLISGSLIVLPRNHRLNASEAQVLTSIQKDRCKRLTIQSNQQNYFNTKIHQYYKRGKKVL